MDLGMSTENAIHSPIPSPVFGAHALTCSAHVGLHAQALVALSVVFCDVSCVFHLQPLVLVNESLPLFHLFWFIVFGNLLIHRFFFFVSFIFLTFIILLLY